MANEIITRSGLTPNEKGGLPFTVTTTDVENYLQGKIDVITREISKLTGKPEEHVEIKVYTTEAGTKFYPFMAILPTSILKNSKKKKNDEPEIFQTNDDNKTAFIENAFYELLSAYTYDGNDEKAFFSDEWRRLRGVARNTSPVLATSRTPKVITLDNGNLQVVSLMLDPVRVFHDMLVIEGGRRDFKVDIQSWQKIKSGEYRYDLKRTNNKTHKNKKYKDTYAEELNRKMRGLN